MKKYMNVSLWQGTPLALVSAILLTGCDLSDSDSDNSSGDNPVLAAFNAVPDLPQITFLREEEVWSALYYGEATDFRSVGADQYDVNFDALLPGDETTACVGDVDKDDFKDDDECTRLQSVSINVLGDHEYVVGLVGHYDNLHVEVYDKTVHKFDTSSDDGEVQFFHWSDALGPLDVYLEPPGTNLSAVQARATLDTGGEFHGLVDEDEYVLSLTAVADPNAPVYTSETFTLTAQKRVAFAILDATENSTSSIKVSRFRDQGGDLLDRRVKTELRLTHVATDVGNVDVFAQEDYSLPFVANLAHRQTSNYLTVDSAALASLQLDVTPAGNPGALLAREQISLAKGTRTTFFLVTSTTGNLDGLNVQDHFRRLTPYAELRLVNSAGTSLDFYVIPHGNNVYTSTANETLSTGSSGGLHLLDPGSYDIWMARTGTDTYVFGPLNVELSGSGNYTVVAIATSDITRVDAVMLDDFAN
jgi:hypothetical protein